MVLPNGDCDLICKDCSLEHEPMKCIAMIFDDVKKLAKEYKKEKAKNNN